MGCFEERSDSPFNFIQARLANAVALSDLDVGVCSIEAIPAPSNLQITAFDQNNVSLGWTSNSGGEETGFEVYMNDALLEGVASGVTSYLDWRPCTIPLNFAATPTALSETSMEISFNDNTNGNSKHDLQRKLSSDPEGSFATIALLNEGDTAHSDTGLTAGTSYDYRIRSVTPLSDWATVTAETASAFTSNWQTDNVGDTAINQIILPTASTGTYDFDVDWGDGNNDTITSWNQAEVTHTYSVAGNYTVKIYRQFDNILVNQDELKLLNISNWGDLKLGNGIFISNRAEHFFGCTNLTLTGSAATEQPDLSLTTTLYSTFKNCSSLTGSFDWDLSGNVVHCREMFNGASGITGVNFTTDSGLTNIEFICVFCSSLTSFAMTDTSGVTNAQESWEDCTSLTSFPLLDLSSCTNFRATWKGCTGLTSFPLIDVSAGTNFIDTWRNCTSLTGNVIPSLNPAAMTDGTNCFNGFDMGTTSYDQILINLDTFNADTDCNFHGGSAKYTKSPSAAATARANLIARTTGWTITDGGATP